MAAVSHFDFIKASILSCLPFTLMRKTDVIDHEYEDSNYLNFFLWVESPITEAIELGHAEAGNFLLLTFLKRECSATVSAGSVLSKKHEIQTKSKEHNSSEIILYPSLLLSKTSSCL